MITALAIITIVLSAIICVLCIIKRRDRKSYESELSDAAVRIKNANSVANKLSSINQAQNAMFKRQGFIHCAKCGKLAKYSISYVDTVANVCICPSCHAKSQCKKDVCHV